MANNDYFAAVEQMANRISGGRASGDSTTPSPVFGGNKPSAAVPNNKYSAVEEFANAIQSTGTRPATSGPAKIQTPELDSAAGNTTPGIVAPGFEQMYKNADQRQSDLGEYAGILSRPDYKALSAAGESKVRLLGGDAKYDYINDINNARIREAGQAVQGRGGGYTQYAYMSADEIGVYNYLYATEGKKAAEKFLSSIEPGLSKQSYSADSNAMTEWERESALNKGVATALTVAAAPVRGISSLVAAGDDVLRTVRGEEINPYSRFRSASNMTTDIRQTAQEDMGRVGRIAYNAVTSGADNLMNLAFARGLAGSGATTQAISRISSALMSSEVMSNAVAEGKEKGYSNVGAMALGLFRGGISYGVEKMGMDWVFKNLAANPGQFLKVMALNALPEGLEELVENNVNEGANFVIDKLFGTSEYYINQMADYYRENGTEKQKQDPVKYAVLASVLNDLEAFTTGALSAFGSTAGGAISNAVTFNEVANQLDTTTAELDTFMRENNIPNVQAVQGIAEVANATSLSELKQTMEYARAAVQTADAAMKQQADVQDEQGSEFNTPQAVQRAEDIPAPTPVSPTETAPQESAQPVSVEQFEKLQTEFDQRKQAWDEANQTGDPNYPYREEIQWLSQAQTTLDQNRSGYFDALSQQRQESGKVSPQFGQPENYIGNRDMKSVGDTKVKAFQFDHPELHPYYLQIAQEVAADVANQMEITTRATKKGWYTIPATNPLIQLLQEHHVTREGAMEALERIMQDNGREDAAAKRAEIYLHWLLVNGYRNGDGTFTPPNQAYIDAISRIPGAMDRMWTDQRNAYEGGFIGSGMTDAEIEAEMQKWDAEHPRPTSRTESQIGGVVPGTEASPAPTAQGPQGPALLNGPADRSTNIPQQPLAGNTYNPQNDTGNVVENALPQSLATPMQQPSPAPAPQTQPTAQTTQQTAAPQGRTTPVRVEPAPADAEGTRLSASVETVQSSPVTTDEFSALIDKTVSEGGYRYMPITNDETVQKATERIRRDGWVKARADWTADVRNGKTSAEMMAMGALLYNNAVNAGDMKAAADIMADYVAIGTNTAQALQARKIIQNMQPEMRLYMIEKCVEKMVSDLNLPDGVTISDSLKEEYLKATTDEQRNEIVTRMQKEVADQIPATFKDKWTALRYVNMLGNFRTQFRNIIGNTTMELLTRAKNGIQVLYESAAEKLTGGKYERTTSVKPNSDLVQAAKAYYNANADVINGEGKYSDNQTATGFMKGVEEQKTIFGKGTRSEWASDLASRIAGRDVEVKKNVLENYRNATNWAMTKGDTVFIGNRFSRSLAGYLQANGIDAATFSGIQDGSIQATAEQQALIDRAVNYATKEAQEATFHDNNALSNWISKIGRKPGTPKAVKAISEGIMPFRKTPANVLLRAEEYSPLGFVNAIYKSIQNKKGTENVTATDVVNSLAKATTGTIMFALGMALRNAGWLRGREDDEKQENFDKLQGEQDYSLNFPGGGSITLDWLSPTSIPLFLGVQFEDAREDGGVSIENALEILSQITNPMIQMSMLQGVNDTLDNIKYSDNNLVQIALSSMVSYLTQGLTNTLVGQIERTSEDRRTSTYLDAETALGRRVQSTLGKISQKTPVWDYNQVEYLDAWGRPGMAEETGFARAFNNMLNPGYVSQANSTEVDNELQRLYDAGMDNVFPQRISMSDKIAVYDEHGQKTGERQLTADEYVQVQREAGQAKLQMVKDLMATPLYDGMSDEARADAISEIYKYANYEAIRKVEPSHEDKYSDVSGLSNIPAYFAAQKTYSNAADNRWTRDYDEIQGMMDSYSTLAPDVRKYLEEKNSQIRKVHDAYEQGVTPETWFQTYDKVQDLEPYGDNKGVSAWQKYETVVQNNPRQADAILQSYMDESAYARYTTARDFGVSPELYIAYYKQNALTDAKDENGKSVNGLKKERMEQWFLSQGYSKAQFNYMYKLFNANTADLANFNAGYR